MLRIATFNLHNFGIDVAPDRLHHLALAIVRELETPDVLGIQEIKALGPADAQGQVSGSQVYERLTDAIVKAGGPCYAFREIPPLENQGGGRQGFNIRAGLIFDPQRVTFEDRGRTGPRETARVRRIAGLPSLILNPCLLASDHPAFAGDARHHWLPSRRPLVSEFRYRDKSIFIVVCHLKSMRGATRREEEYAKKQRHAQAEVIQRFVTTLLACDPRAAVVVMGDMNDVPGSKTLAILKGEHLLNLLEVVPNSLRYTYRPGGRPVALDHILVSPALATGATVHVAHLADKYSETIWISDHDPVLARLEMRWPNPISL